MLVLVLVLEIEALLEVEGTRIFDVRVGKAAEVVEVEDKTALLDTGTLEEKLDAIDEDNELEIIVWLEEVVTIAEELVGIVLEEMVLEVGPSTTTSTQLQNLSALVSIVH